MYEILKSHIIIVKIIIGKRAIDKLNYRLGYIILTYSYFKLKCIFKVYLKKFIYNKVLFNSSSPPFKFLGFS